MIGLAEKSGFFSIIARAPQVTCGKRGLPRSCASVYSLEPHAGGGEFSKYDKIIKDFMLTLFPSSSVRIALYRLALGEHSLDCGCEARVGSDRERFWQ